MKLARNVLTCVAGSALALGCLAADEPVKIYECEDAKGNVVYQDDPCIEAAPPTAKPKAAALPWAAVIPPARPPAQPSLQNPSVDARWATPEKTLKTFIGAVKVGDRALVLASLTSSAMADLGPDVEALPLEELRATVGAFTGYVMEGDLGPYWSIRALRTGMRPKWIFFERTGDGTWKIGAF